ncbi:MAG TPA: sulfatase-like hydrolase/transferase, partial [Vicinamibacterales bacterium]|nr:sulfatase-like hydrolase/transferase [Vicinamibacterales bacterium]
MTRAAVAALFALAALGAQAPPPNVLLITIDTVRADHVGAYGAAKTPTPTLDALAKEGVRFADATSQAPLTGPAHAALLTGRYPARYGVRDNAATAIPESETTIAERFKAQGYRTGGFVAAFILDRQYGFAQGFDAFDAHFAKFTTPEKLEARRTAADVVDAALPWIAARNPQPFFAWVHLYDAHAPYRAPAAYRTRFPSSPYDASIAYVDASIGRIVAALRQSGALDRTIVSVIADHGEGLGEHGEETHGLFLYDTTLHVPWILRLPGSAHAGTLVREQVRAIDLAPTLAALAGLPAAHDLDGENVVPAVEGRVRRDTPPSYAETFYPKLHFGWSELTSVRAGGWKYIDAPKPELYDVVHDGAERDNAIDRRGALANGLSAEIAKTQSGFGPAARAEAPQPDPETLARLRSLGYVGVAAPSASGRRGPDPKDMIGTLESYNEQIGRVTRALQTGNAAAAIPILKQLVAGNDRSYELHLNLGDAYLGAKQYRDALDEYAAARLLNPSTAAPIVAAARAHLAMGDAPAALRDVAAAEAVEPRTDEVALVRGMIHEQQQVGAAALGDYQAAVAANSSNAAA